MKKIISIILLCIIALSINSCGKIEEPITTSNNTSTSLPKEKNDTERTVLRIASTTSLGNTGLLEVLEEDFEKNYPYDIEYIIVGSGAAIKAGESGEVDGIFVHSKSAEEKLIKDGASLGRNTIMYNYFQIVGAEPLTATDYESIINEIRESKTFVSRGDQSGTNVKELALWEENLPKDYVETGKGMLDTLIITDEMKGYTLTDDATFISNNDKFELVEIYKDDENFKNEYSFHCMNPELNDYINKKGAQEFLDYLLMEETLNIIANYGVNEYGQALYALSN